jgi:hypothetical protein
MTDEELRKQLREVTGGKLFFTNTPNHLRLTAADRIEQLQTKLAKAMAALEWVVSAKGLTDPTEYGYGAIKHARVVLEEIKGET